jgi:hypothetical protein
VQPGASCNEKVLSKSEYEWEDKNKRTSLTCKCNKVVQHLAVNIIGHRVEQL